MATYQDLSDWYGTSERDALRNKIAVAAMVKAEAISTGATPTAAQIGWAKSALSNPRSVADDLLNFVIAANKGASIAAINGASDNAIQGHVNSAVDTLYGV